MQPLLGMLRLSSLLELIESKKLTSSVKKTSAPTRKRQKTKKATRTGRVACSNDSLSSVELRKISEGNFSKFANTTNVATVARSRSAAA